MNSEHLEEFFDLLQEPYQKWYLEAKKGNRKSPYFDIGKQLAGTVFSYPGFEFTSNHRNQSKSDEIISKMITKSIEGPTLLFDWGTYDGGRLHKILTSIPKEKQEQIIAIYGIDINNSKLEDATNLFENFSIPFNPISKRIENLDFKEIAKGDLYNSSNLKKLTLALDNVVMNFNGLSCNHEEGVVELLKRTHNVGDLIILQAHNTIDQSKYSQNVEDFFWNYFKESGVEEVIGGTLIAECYSFRKTVHIEQMNEKVEFGGKTYKFPWGIGDADPARIAIGISGVIPYEKMNEFLRFNYVNKLLVPSKEDVAYVDSDVVIRFKKF